MATNVTARTVSKLVADGERLCDGLRDHGVAVGIMSNPEAKVRELLEALKQAAAAFGMAQSDETRASQAAMAADEANALFIQRFVYWMSMIYGGKWSDRWIATGLPDRVVGVPRLLAKRFVLMGSIRAFLEAHPEYEVSHSQVEITAAKAWALHEAYSDAHSAANAKRGEAAAAKKARDVAFRTFRKRYSWAMHELRGDLAGNDPRWVLFGLRAPDAPQTPDAPKKVTAVAAGNGHVLVKSRWPRRAHSINFYRKIAGVDAEPVKVENCRGKEFMIGQLPPGATVEITVTGVNDAGEGRACEAVRVVV